ncbi:ABC transporter ATP-binding protein, partial [Planctomycetota bacterium]
MPLISFSGLGCYYGRVCALEDLTLEIEKGTVGLLGPNGAGKSTLIKVLLGLVEPSHGGGTVLGLNIRDRRHQLRIRQRVGYMPELDCHIPELNAVQLVSLCGELTGMARVEAMQRAHEALYYVAIGDERYRKVDTYSQGMRQKVKLAQALVHSPDLVLLDEPTNGLDPHGREAMLQLVTRIWEEKGISVLFSSHLLPDVERVCERVIVIDRGSVRLTGGVQELRAFHRETYRVIVAERRDAFLERLAAESWHAEA